MAKTATAARPKQKTAGSTIDVAKVSHHFTLASGDLKVLDSISLHVEAGEFISLLGPSGCGKSTLLRLIAGLEKAATGTIHADGALVENPDPSRILAFQDATLFPWATVW